jgi:peptide/nickel transport system ATP-binding protein
VGIVGESGCGKSITSLSIMQLVQKPQGHVVDGAIRFAADGKIYDIVKTPAETMRKIRGNHIAMIFQEPMTSLNPVLRVGHQVDEVLLFHQAELRERGVIRDTSKEAVKRRSIEMLELVGISNAAGVYRMFPHELSGGMVQRVMISMALACAPSLIIADEPTTALDVTIQAQILDLLRDLKDKINASIMLITHDLGVVAEMADFVVVMYAGRIVERGTAEDIYKKPAHPYTLGLMKSKPVLNHAVDRLYSIPGKVPNPVRMPNYCYFKDRCEFALAECAGAYPGERAISPTHRVACYRREP